MHRSWLAAPLLAAALAIGCGGDGGRSPLSAHSGGSDVPEPLVGEWTASSGSGGSYWDPNSGHYGTPSGNQYSFTFNDDGTYAYAELISSSLYSCEMQIFGYDSGSVDVTGTDITVHPEEATLKSTDTCNAEWNYEKDVDMGDAHYRWAFQVDEYDGATNLVMTYDDGSQRTYRKKT